jgi:hypothetical protein
MSTQVETVRPAVARQSFWDRQFAGEATARQRAYDVMLGIVMPILCFIFDPIVFSSGGFINNFVPLSPFRLLVYLFSALAIVALAAWLFASRDLKSSAGIIAGVLLSGALCSLVLGILILPLSLLGLIVLVGALGFTPFFTAFTYLRNGVRAVRMAEAHVSRGTLVGTVLAGALVVIAVPVAAHVGVERVVSQAMRDLMRGDPQAMETAVNRLKYVGWSANLDDIVWAYSKEQDPTRKQNLARAYEQITGHDIKNRLAILLD